MDLNVKYKAMKFLKESTGDNLGDFGFGNKFLDTTPKT